MYFTGSDEDDGSGFSMGMPDGSKLQSLFGPDKGASQGGNASLMYVPTKPPKAKDEETTDGPLLMYACACHTFKYTNGQYVNQGKLGVAVLGNLAAKDYKLHLYQSQKKPVTNAKITPTFAFNVQKNNYVSFYDDKSQNWSICFENEEHLSEVGKRIAMAKFNITPNVLAFQDLNYQATQEVQKGDTVEVKYTGWLHDGNTFGKVFDSNEKSGKLLKFKVGKGKVIKGWDLGVIGMKKSSRRLFIIPADLAAESKDIGPKIPANCPLIFQLEVTRVKFTNPQVDGDTVSLCSQMEVDERKDIDTKSDSLPSQSSHESMKDKTKNISEQLSRPAETSKSKLLERMSKMGQSIIPVSGVTNSVSIEDDEEENHERKQKPIVHIPESSKPELLPKPDSPSSMQASSGSSQGTLHTPIITQPISHPPLQGNPIYQPPPIGLNTMYHAQQQQHQQQQQQQLALYQSPQAVQAAMFGYPTAIPQLPQVAAQPAGMSATEMNLMLTDGRLKHTEIKSDLNRIVDKIDAISSKINNLENANKQVQIISQPPQQQQMFTQGPEMEANVIMQNITRIIKENEKLRSECEEKTKKIELLNERMTDLLTKNQQFFEKSNQLLVSQTDSMQNNATQAMAKVSHLEDHNMRLQSELSLLKSQLLQSHGQQDASSKNEGQLANKIETLKQELIQVKEGTDAANTLTVEREGIIDELKEKLKNVKIEQKQLHLKLVQFEEDTAELKSEKESLSKQLGDVKKKRKGEKEKNDEELEELKSQHEDEMRSLRGRYKKNSGNETEKITRLEEELTQQYEEKMKTKIKTLERSHNEVMNRTNEENDILKEDLRKVKEKLSNLSEEHAKQLLGELENAGRKISNEYEKKINTLKDTNELLVGKLQMAETKAQEKTIEPQQQSDDLLQKLNDQIEEIEQLKVDSDHAYDRGLKDGRATMESISTASYERGLSEGKSIAVSKMERNATPATTPSVSREKIAEEVKKVMNSVFFKTRSEFQAEQMYDGKQVVTTLLNTIKEITLKMVENTDANDDSNDSEEELSEEEEDTDEDKEEEEVEEEEVEEEEESEEEDSTEQEVRAGDAIVYKTVESEVYIKAGESQIDASESNKTLEEIPTDIVESTKPSEKTSTDINVTNTTKSSHEIHTDISDIETATNSGEAPIETAIKTSGEPHSDVSEGENTEEPQTDVNNDNIYETRDDPSIREGVTSKLSKKGEADNNEYMTTKSSETQLYTEYNSSTSMTGKTSLGDSGDEHYATDEGEMDINEDLDETEGKQDIQGKKTRSDLINELLSVVESNENEHHPPENDVDKEINTVTLPNTVDNVNHVSTENIDVNVSNQTSSSDEYGHVDDKDNVNGNIDLPIESNYSDVFTKAIDLSSALSSFDDQSEDVEQSDTRKLSFDDFLVGVNSHQVAKSDSLEDNLTLPDNTSDKLSNGVLDVAMPNNTSNNTLEDLGLDSSLFTRSEIKTVDKDNSLINNDDESNRTVVNSQVSSKTQISEGGSSNTLRDLGLDISMFTDSETKTVSKDDSLFNETNGTVENSKEVPKSQTSEERSTIENKSTIGSIFRESDSDEELFNPKVPHKVSPFVRNPPPLFEDDDDDVNWI